MPLSGAAVASTAQEETWYLLLQIFHSMKSLGGFGKPESNLIQPLLPTWGGA